MDSNQQYTVLARRFRPQTFDEVVGQQHIAQALKNAIAASRVAHAYLFTGARGVGKTSMARILAKALNCSNVKDGNPCNECEICKGIAAGHDVDVMEIDGASNRGIDDIRSLRANVNVKSMRTKYKMYIIDEVHMLTKEAFNALLKTLEEPPPNVKFVFATTEPNKLPDTILSRCQRFDFSTIELTNIISRLKQIAESEGYEVSEEALELVARRAAGSMRDSQSLFDQLLAFGEEKITADDVHRLLGTANDDRLIELVGYLLNQNQKETLECFDKTLEEGVQLGELLDQIINYFRDLMVLSTRAENVSLMAVSESCRQTLSKQVQQFGLQTILAGLQILSDTKTRIFRASFARALVEMALVRITLLKNLDVISDLLAAIRQGVPVPVTNISNPGAVISGSPATPVSSGKIESNPVHETKVNPPIEPEVAKPVEPEQKLPVANENLENQEKKRVTEEKFTLHPASSESVEPDKINFVPENEKEIWSQVLSITSDTNKPFLAKVQKAAIIGPNRLDLQIPASYSFVRNKFEKSGDLKTLETSISQIAGKPIQVVFSEIQDSPAPGKSEPETSATTTTKKIVKQVPKPGEDVGDELVDKAVEVFKASIIKVDGIQRS